VAYLGFCLGGRGDMILSRSPAFKVRTPKTFAYYIQPMEGDKLIPFISPRKYATAIHYT